MIDILIKNASTITVDPQRRVYRRGAIAVDQGKILEVGPTEPLELKYQARTVIDGTRMIAMPGLINCHFHLPQVLMRGLADDVDCMTVLKDYIWSIQGCYDSSDALASTNLGLLEMIKSGTTAFLSTGLHPRYGIDAVAQAVADSGMRAALSKYVMDLTGYALEQTALHAGLWEKGDESVKLGIELIERWNGAAHGRIQMWFSPRSVGGVSPELFKRVSRLAADFGVGLTTHWSEIQNNVDYCRETYGLLPAEFAAQVGMLGKNVTLAHGIYFTDREIDMLAETGTNICHCPACNAKLAMGTARVSEMFRKGVNVCLGTDGTIVNNTADMFREMRASLIAVRGTFADPHHPTAAEAIEMATINGARAILADHLVGSLEAGKQADIVLIDANQPHLMPVHDPVAAVAWAANGSDVDTVLIDGRIVMRGRKVLTMDEDKVLREAEAHQDKILAQSGVKANHVWPLL